MIFYSSELFFGNEDVAKRRHFSNADSMNIRIIENWNSIVTQSDKVYIIGGIGQFEFLLSLNGEKFLMLSPYEQDFYDEYIKSVTTDLEDEYNDEMFSVYLRNMFYINETIYDRTIFRKDYTGNLIRISSTEPSDTVKGNELYAYSVYGAIGEHQRVLTHNTGINANIFVNGMFPVSEGDIEALRKYKK